MTDKTQLGIDFGSSQTVAIVDLDARRTRPLFFDGSPFLPSAVLADTENRLIVGADALRDGRARPGNLEPNPKRRIDDGELLLGERIVRVDQAIGAVLARVLAEYERTIGVAPDDVTITYPANWGATRRRTLTDAAAAIGLTDVRLLPEPVAAAMYFADRLEQKLPDGSAIVVYDFGAGTFDVSVVQRTGASFDVLALEGRDNIGGLEIDELVLKMLAANCPPDGWRRLADPSSLVERRAALAVRDEARIAKERLSRNASVTVTVPLLNRDVVLTREELEQRARILIDRTVRITEGVIRSANLPTERIVGVFLVGGASRMPLIATQLHRSMGRPPITIEQPEFVVAEGSVLPDRTPNGSHSTPETSGAVEHPLDPDKTGLVRDDAGILAGTKGRWMSFFRRDRNSRTASDQPGASRPDQAATVKSVLSTGWNGVAWGADIAEFKARFPQAERQDSGWWWTGEGAESFCGVPTAITQYGFNDEDRLYMVAFIPDPKDRDKLPVAVLNELGAPNGNDSSWTIGTVEVSVKIGGVVATLVSNRFAE
ncbi:Hsp70 family protein [Polymorphospora sp. NPDC051019]|uniref:Hsp70 family protein n=1 Tax=Polymorphospora sp. NPDC051019 TaxID=3155725 RepID=UPI003412F45D